MFTDWQVVKTFTIYSPDFNAYRTFEVEVFAEYVGRICAIGTSVSIFDAETGSGIVVNRRSRKVAQIYGMRAEGHGQKVWWEQGKVLVQAVFDFLPTEVDTVEIGDVARDAHPDFARFWSQLLYGRPKPEFLETTHRLLASSVLPQAVIDAMNNVEPI